MKHCKHALMTINGQKRRWKLESRGLEYITITLMLIITKMNISMKWEREES